MIREFRYTPVGRNKWVDKGVVELSIHTDTRQMSLGQQAFSYLKSLQLFDELKLILQHKIDQLKTVDSMDIYIDEGSECCLLNILFFDDDGDQVAEPFSVDIYTRLDAVKFAIYTFEPMFNEINMFVVASFQRSREIEQLEEHYEIGEYVEQKSRYRR